ncbi:MAG: ArsI/CadI family heavy metal resistance metalloenzyme [Cyanobacteria bacterium P01_F01_bin.4]
MNLFKTHIALRVSDINRSIAFYQTMFGVAPVKHKVGYAKFDLDNLGLNLTLNASDVVPAQGVLSHLGIQVDSTDSLRDEISRLQSVGINPVEAFNTDCCYALQDKAWVTDPDGTRWEFFVIHIADTAPELTINPIPDNPIPGHMIPEPPKTSPARTCCAPTCCA